ncbi:antiviral reverse transcriptase Drt3a [Rheinheimera baltica]|uniref:antiviral reverse transcriptase Drt3a n=1 Tax=Rheinheimera baltica TaxID=67576 RepID=UPI00273F11B6|nr:antiviral reverse transcriptase Drt3a [Rheinheimera baltica]MDP5191960.1 reverse transcriptase domain-containing protein [Rheinheimera baltica]
MNEKAYIAGNLRKAVRYRNLLKISEFKHPATLDTVAVNSVFDINNNSIWTAAISNVKVKGKDAWMLNEPKAILAHNLLVKNIERNYSTRCNDRKFTIQLLLSHLKDCYNYSVHRLDVKSFYESFDRREIIRKLKSDSILSKKSLKILEALFEELDSIGVKGLPRGMGISSTLSELMMNNFDVKLKSMKEVLFYARFVDDIIVISTPLLNRNLMKERLQDSSLPLTLEFHTSGDKVTFEQIEKAPSKQAKEISFDFLGYQFNIERAEDSVGRNIEFKRRSVKVSIAKNKIKKIKKRIICSFAAALSFNRANDADIQLLNKRMKFLSKNFLLESSSSAPNIYSGIYHNYNFIDQYEGLKELDNFYKNLLFGNRSRLSKRIKRSLAYSTRKGLAKHSFERGFQNREFCRLSYLDFKEIKRAWS